MNYTALKTPGVYVNEISIFPPSVAQVPTAIPAFIGYTERHLDENGETLLMKPKKISSFVDFQLLYGGPPPVNFSKIELDASGQVVKVASTQNFYLSDSLQMFYANGGGECYIISVGDYTGGSVQLGTSSPATGLLGGLEILSEVDEPTMIVSPDAVSLSGMGIYSFQQAALTQCGKLMDRVGVFDLLYMETKTQLNTKVAEFRNQIGMSDLKYGAVYAPWLKTDIRKDVRYRDLVGKLFKAGTNLPVLLSNYLSNLPPADQAVIQPELVKLDAIVADNKFMNETAPRSVKNYLTTFPAVAGPVGWVGPFASIESGYDVTEEWVLTKLAEADADSNAVSKDTKTHTAAVEYQKLIRQAVQVVTMIDDFSFLDNVLGIKSTALQTFAFDQIKYSANNTPLGGNQFNGKTEELLNVDLTSVSTAGAVQRAISSTLASGNSITGNAPYTGLNYEVLTFDAQILAPPALNTALFVTNVIGGTTVGDSTNRINNMKAALPVIRGLFTYFRNILESILEFGSAYERTIEDGLIKMWPLLKNILVSVSNNLTILPPSGAMAGVYARVDNERGVWKAPANVSLLRTKALTVNINDLAQESLNVDVDSGKSVNAIRVFSGKGVMVWGARTLAGNDNEWRYISVRRLFNMVEESVKKSTSWVVFEPNDANTWVKVKSMIENYLTLLWRQGALAGAKPDEAFRVYVGLKQTMTFVDILEGRMIIRIEMAPVRPAEFIILEFTHKIQTS